MSERVRITDVAPRDGLQNEPGVLVVDDKVRLIELLARTGVDEIEATSFVSPKWIPQLGDAAEVLATVRDQSIGNPPTLSALVPNRKGFERALKLHSESFPLKLAIFTAASESFSQKNTNGAIAETLERFREFAPEALARGMRMRMYVSCAVACPFEGAIEPNAVRKVVDALIDLVGAQALADDHVEIDLGDTIGAADEGSMHRLLDAFDEPALLERLALHLHDTFGRAAACARVGLERGVRRFDGSAAGLGGCPYASKPGQRAPGNIATETLVRTVHDAGFETGVDLDKLTKAATFAQRVVNEARAAKSGA